MLVTSRSYAEYQAMFALDEQALGGRVLDCCAGSSSFVAELADRGGHGMAVDPAYARPVAELIAARDAGDLGGDQNPLRARIAFHVGLVRLTGA